MYRSNTTDVHKDWPTKRPSKVVTPPLHLSLTSIRQVGTFINDSLPRVPKIKIQDESQASFSKYLTLSLPRSVMETFKVLLNFESVDEILWCDHSNDSSSVVLPHGTIYINVFYKITFESCF